MDKVQIISEIIKSRRSIFPPMYATGKIDDQIIDRLLDLAVWAPTHAKTQPWRFHVMTGEALQRLSHFAGKWYKDNTPVEKFSELKHNKMMSFPLSASHVIALGMKRDEKERIPEWEEVAALSMAVQNMWLACSAMGLGCYWASPGNIRDADKIVALEENERCYGWFYIGIPNESGQQAKSERESAASKTKWYR